MVDVNSIKKNCWLVFFSVGFLGLLGPYNLDCFWWIYVGFLSLFTSWTLYLIYACERYVLYLMSQFISAIFVFSYMAGSSAYVSFSASLGKTNALSIMGGISPVILVCVVLGVIYYGKPTCFPFEVTGNRVTAKQKKRRRTKYNPGLIAGVTTAAGSLFINSVEAATRDLVAILGGTASSIMILFFLRHSIRGLRTLRIQEGSMTTPYTFMQIEEIREARSRWLLGRFFKWITSLFDSPVPK
jgi:hypothetical protein